MALEALKVDYEDGVSAAFLRNHHGKVCIAFSDPTWVKSETIIVDPKDFSVHAILGEVSHFITKVSEVMARALAENEEALLSAIQVDGSVFESNVPIEVGHS